MLLEHFSIPEKLKLPSQKHLFDAKEAVRRHAQRRRKNKSSLVEEALELEREMGFTIDSDTSGLTLFKHARTMVDVTLSENKSLYIFQLDSKFRILCVKIAEHGMFHKAIFCLIAISCISLAAEGRSEDPRRLVP
jgi:hypothetical protein